MIIIAIRVNDYLHQGKKKKKKKKKKPLFKKEVYLGVPIVAQR